MQSNRLELRNKGGKEFKSLRELNRCKMMKRLYIENDHFISLSYNDISSFLICHILGSSALEFMHKLKPTIP